MFSQKSIINELFLWTIMDVRDIYIYIVPSSTLYDRYEVAIYLHIYSRGHEMGPLGAS